MPDAEDPRKTALKNGLRQLGEDELRTLRDWLENGLPVLLDRDASGAANYSHDEHEGDVFCPLAVALDLPWLYEHYEQVPDDEHVAAVLKRRFSNIYNTRGVVGNFYTTNRRADLLTATEEVLEEICAR